VCASSFGAIYRCAIMPIIDETSQYGNVIKGWDGFLNAKPKVFQTRRVKINEKDRIFSSSSTTAPDFNKFEGKYDGQ
jgi:Histone acetyltransferase subunit NuA4